MNYGEAISFENLYEALLKVKAGVMWKDSTSSYFANGFKKTYELRQSLLLDTYTISKYSIFNICEPKKREIVATRIRDRQFQKALVDNILYPQLTARFTDTNCACLKNRGTSYAIKILKQELRDYYWSHHSNCGYVYQFDVHHYFPSTSIRVMQNVLEEYITDKEALARTCEIIESFSFSAIYHELKNLGFSEAESKSKAYRLSSIRSRATYLRYMSRHVDETEMMRNGRKAINDDTLLHHFLFDDFRGIGLGSNVSQLSMLALLDHLDHILLERYHYHLRYMDDFLIISDSRAEAEESRKIVEEELARLGLTLNDKSHLFRLQDSIHLLHWRFILTKTGKVIMKKERSKLKRERRVLKNLKEKLDCGKCDMNYIRQSFNAWQSQIEQGNTYHQVKNMRDFYFNLFEEVAPNGKYFKRG